MDDKALIERALSRDKLAVSTLVSLFEDQRQSAIARRAFVYERLFELRKGRSAAMLGLTGTPGSGKSTLIALDARALAPIRSCRSRCWRSTLRVTSRVGRCSAIARG